MSTKIDNFTAPPCIYEPAMLGDVRAPLAQLRQLAQSVCLDKCDAMTFRYCDKGTTLDDRWTVRAGKVRVDVIASQTAQRRANKGEQRP